MSKTANYEAPCCQSLQPDVVFFPNSKQLPQHFVTTHTEHTQ